MQRHIPLASLGINTISNCCVGVTRLERERGGGGGGGVRAAAVMMTAFQRKAVTFALHVDHPAAHTQRISSSARECQREEESADQLDMRIPHHDASTGNLLLGEEGVLDDMGEGGDEGDGEGDLTDMSHTVTPKKKIGWLHPVPAVAAVSHTDMLCDGESAVSARDASRHTDINDGSSVGTQIAESADTYGGSFYADLSVPLSLFLVEGVLPHAAAGSKTILPSPSAVSGTSNTDMEKEKEKEKEKGHLKVTDKERAKDSWESPLKDKSGRVVDQPVTFQTHMRSSGYGQQVAKKTSVKVVPPRRQSASGPRPTDRTSAPLLRSASGVSSGPRIRIYPRNCDPMTVHQGYNDYPPVRGASSSVYPAYAIAYRYHRSSSCLPLVNCILQRGLVQSISNHVSKSISLSASFSPFSYVDSMCPHSLRSSDASQLAIATGDSVVSTLKLPVSRNNGDGAPCFCFSCLCSAVMCCYMSCCALPYYASYEK